MKSIGRHKIGAVRDRFGRATTAALLALLALIGMGLVRGNEHAPHLFITPATLEDDPVFHNASATGNSQLVQLNPLVTALLHSQTTGRPLQISMPLGPNVAVPLTLTNRQSPGLNRVLWRGDAGTANGGFVTLALSGDAAAGSIFLPGLGSYQIQYAGQGRHRVRRIDEIPVPPCGVKSRPNATSDLSVEASSLEPHFIAASSPPASGDETNAILDLLVVYTAAARNGAGGTNGMIALIDAAVAEANLAFENSLVNARLRLARAAEVDYSESGDINEDLDRLEDDGEGGPLYGVRQLRGQSRADLVCLITENTGGPYGLANQMREVELEFGEKAFSVIKREFAVAYQSLAHEIGHNLGCQHDRTTSSSGGAFGFSHALRFEVDGTLYHTVMAYQPGLPVPHFSNPDVSFMGVPTGIASPSANSADNARTINLTAATAARFDLVMPRGTPPTVTLLSPTNGATFTVPALVALIAEASDDDGDVVEVEFYVNGAQIGRRYERPFTFSWTNSVPGTYTVLVEARDNAGWEVSSARSRIRLLPPPPSIDLPACRVATDGTYQIRVKGFDGQGFRLERSKDLEEWNALLIDELIGDTLDYIDTPSSDGTPRFYRVLPEPTAR